MGVGVCSGVSGVCVVTGSCAVESVVCVCAQGGQWWLYIRVSGLCVHRDQFCINAGVSGGVCTVSSEGGCAQVD